MTVDTPIHRRAARQWAPYLDTLPTEADSSAWSPTPDFFDDAELAATEWPPLVEAATARRERVAALAVENSLDAGTLRHAVWCASSRSFVICGKPNIEKNNPATGKAARFEQAGVRDSSAAAPAAAPAADGEEAKDPGAVQVLILFSRARLEDLFQGAGAQPRHTLMCPPPPPLRLISRDIQRNIDVTLPSTGCRYSCR